MTTEDLQIIRTDFETVQKRVAALQVVDSGTRAIATESIALLKRILQKAEESREQKVRPLNTEVKAINARYKEFSEPATHLLNDLNRKVIDFVRKQEEEARRIEQEQRRLQEEAERKQREAEKKAEKRGVAPPPPKPVPVLEVPQVQKMAATSFGSVSVQENWTWEVLDEKLIPRDYLKPDDARITRVVKAGVREISGLRIFNEGKVSLR